MGRGDGIFAGFQIEVVGDGLAHLILLTVNTGGPHVSGAGPALGANIGVHQTPGVVTGLELIELIVQQLIAQHRFHQFIVLGGLRCICIVQVADGIDEVNQVVGYDLHGYACGQGHTQNGDAALYHTNHIIGAVHVGEVVGFIAFPDNGHLLDFTVAVLYHYGAGQSVGGQAAIAQNSQPGGQFALNGNQSSSVHFQLLTQGVERVDLQSAGLENDLHGVLVVGQAGQSVGLKTGAAGGSFCVFSNQVAVHIHIQNGAAVVAAGDGKAGAGHREVEGEFSARGFGHAHGAVPVVGAAAAGLGDIPHALIRVGHAVILTVHHAGGVGDGSLDGGHLQVIEVDHAPGAAQLDAACIHGIGVGVAVNHLAVQAGNDHVAVGMDLCSVLALGIGFHFAVGQLGAATVELPVTVAVHPQGVAVLVPVHTGLAAHAYAGPYVCICTGDLYINAGGVVHPAEVAHDGHGVAAVPLTHFLIQDLSQLAVLHDPRAVGVQHIAGLVAACSQVAHSVSILHAVLAYAHVSFLGVLKVVGVQVLVGGIQSLAGGVGVQHQTVLGVDAFRGHLQVFLAVLVQSGGGHHAVGGDGDDPAAVSILFQGLALLHVAVGLGYPGAQLLIFGQLHVLGGDGKGLGVLGVVDKYGGEILLVRICHGQVACIAVDAGGVMLVFAACKGFPAGVYDQPPDALGVVFILPAGIGKTGEVRDHLERGIVMDVAAPGVTGAGQLLVSILDALVEGAQRRLEHVVSPAGGHEGGGHAVHQCQRALVAADALVAVLAVLVLLQFGVTEGGAAFAVPDFLIVHLCHLHIILGGAGAVMEADDVHSIVQIFVRTHAGHNVQSLVLVGSDDADAPVSILRFLGEVVGEFGLILDPIREVLDQALVGVGGLVPVRVHEVHHIAVLFVGIEDGLAVPGVHLIPAALVVGIPVGEAGIRNPVGVHPAQHADLHIRVHGLRVRRHYETGRTGGIRLVIRPTHGAGFRTGGVVAVVTHFHLDVGEQRMLAAEQVLHHLPVFVGMLGLVVQQQVAGAVAVQHAPALPGQAVYVFRCGVHIGAVQQDLGGLHFADGSNQLAVGLIHHSLSLVSVGQNVLGSSHRGFQTIAGQTLLHQNLSLFQVGFQIGGIDQGQGLLGILAGQGLGLELLRIQNLIHDHNAVVQALLQVAGAHHAAQHSLNVGHGAQLEADVGHFSSLHTVHIDDDGTIAASLLFIGQGNGVPLALFKAVQLSAAGAYTAAVAAEAQIAVLVSTDTQGVFIVADIQCGTTGQQLAGGTVFSLHIHQNSERGGTELGLCVVDGGMVAVGIVPVHIDLEQSIAARAQIGDGAVGVGQTTGLFQRQLGQLRIGVHAGVRHDSIAPLCLDCLVLLSSDAQRRTMTGAAGHFEFDIRGGEYTAGQIVGHNRIIADAAEIIQQQAVFAVFPVIRVQAEDGGTFHPLLAVQGIRFDLSPLTQQGVGGLQEYGLGQRAQLVGVAALVLGEAVVLAVLTLNDSGIDAGLVILDPHLRLSEGIEVTGLYHIDPMDLVAGGTLGAGCPVHQILAGDRIVGGFGGPSAAGIVFRAYVHHTLLGPVHQIVGLPDHQGLAAVALCTAPVVVAVDLQVGGDQVEAVALRRADDEGIANALLAQCGVQRRLVVVQILPVQAILAGSKVDLLAVGIAFTCKVSEKVVGEVRIGQLLESGLYGQLDLLGSLLVSQRQSGGHGYLGVLCGTGHHTGGNLIVTIHGSLLAFHGHDLLMVGSPLYGNLTHALRQGDIAAHIIRIGDGQAVGSLLKGLAHIQALHNHSEFLGLGFVIQAVRSGQLHGGILAHNGMDGAVVGQNIGIIRGPGHGNAVYSGRKAQIFGHCFQTGVAAQHCRLDITGKILGQHLGGGLLGSQLLSAEGIVPNLEIRQICGHQRIRGVQRLTDIAGLVLRDHILDLELMGHRGNLLAVQVKAQLVALAHHGNGGITLLIGQADRGSAVRHTDFLPVTAGTYLDGGKDITIPFGGSRVHKDIVAHIFVVPVAEAVTQSEHPVCRLGSGGGSELHGEFLTGDQSGGQGSKAVLVHVPVAAGKAGIGGTAQGSIVAIAADIHQCGAVGGHVIAGHQFLLHHGLLLHRCFGCSGCFGGFHLRSLGCFRFGSFSGLRLRSPCCVLRGCLGGFLLGSSLLQQQICGFLRDRLTACRFCGRSGIGRHCNIHHHAGRQKSCHCSAQNFLHHFSPLSSILFRRFFRLLFFRAGNYRISPAHFMPTPRVFSVQLFLYIYRLPQSKHKQNTFYTEFSQSKQ